MVLVGPAVGGKSTLGAMVGALTGSPFVDLDEIGDRYYREVGWSIVRLTERAATVGRVAAEREWEPARAHAVRRVVEEHPGAVVALGAGHTSYTDPQCTASVAEVLALVPHVVLVVPSRDRDAALAELRRRSLETKRTDWVVSGHDFLAEWLDEPTNEVVATLVVVTGAEGATATAVRIAAHLQVRGPDEPWIRDVKG